MTRALLVGINSYPGQRLTGCVNDVTAMAEFLVARCGFAKSDIRILVDNRADKAAIIERLGWLLGGLQKGGRILFHYSGHGVKIASRNAIGDVHHIDEAICPVNFEPPDKNAITDRDF